MDVISRMRPEDMVVDLNGNWIDGPTNSSQCSEIAIQSCIMRARRDVISVTHVHPDYALPMSVFEKELKPMAQEGAALVSKPIPVLPQMKIISTEEEGEAVAKLLR